MRTPRKPSLANALFSKVRQRVLALLFGHPDRSFHTNEIIRLTHSGTGAIQRELKQLAAVGLIAEKSIGNQKHYQANPLTPLFSELRSIVLKTFGLADVVQDALTPIQSQIDIAFIFGSVAKQEDSARSDIDLMLISDNLSYADVFKLLEKIEKPLGRPIHPTIYTTSEWTRKLKMNHHFVAQLEQQPKIFLIGSEHELNQLILKSS